MVGRTLDRSEAEVTPTAHQAGSDSLPAMPVSAGKRTADAAIIGRTSRPVSDGMGCVRGIRMALLIEAAAALLFYGLWQLRHFLR